MKRRWRDRCCSIRRSLPFAVVAFLLLVLHEPPRAHAFVAKDHGCQTRRGASNRRSQRLFTFIQNVAQRTFGGRDDEGSHNEVQQPSRRPTPKKASSGVSHSSSYSLKFRNMQDLLDSLSSPNETLLIVFTATNCGPCKLQKQELSEFRQRLTNERDQGLQPEHEADDDDDSHDTHSPSDVPLKMLAIDTEKWPHVGLAWFKVSKLPCVVVLRNKQVVARMEGLTRAKDLLEHVRPHLLP